MIPLQSDSTNDHLTEVSSAAPSVASLGGCSTTGTFNPYDQRPKGIHFKEPNESHNSFASSLIRGRELTGMPQGPFVSEYDCDSGNPDFDDSTTVCQFTHVDEGTVAPHPSSWAEAMAHQPCPSQASQDPMVSCTLSCVAFLSLTPLIDFQPLMSGLIPRFPITTPLRSDGYLIVIVRFVLVIIRLDSHIMHRLVWSGPVCPVLFL